MTPWDLGSDDESMFPASSDQLNTNSDTDAKEFNKKFSDGAASVIYTKIVSMKPKLETIARLTKQLKGRHTL